VVYYPNHPYPAGYSNYPYSPGYSNFPYSPGYSNFPYSPGYPNFPYSGYGGTVFDANGRPLYGGYGGYGGPVYDANGRPLYNGYDWPAASQSPYQPGLSPSSYPLGPSLNWYPPATPDLSGSAYVVLRDGSMQVDFGGGDTRTVPSCAAMDAQTDPAGRPRTIFYTPPPGGVTLHEGQRGRVLGRPAAGAHACYGADAFGRMALEF
jgi:hypothetical protein